MARIKIRSDLADYADKLFKDNVLFVGDGKKSHSLARELRPLRVNGELSISYDREMRKSVFVLTVKKKRKRKDHPGWGMSSFSF